MQLETASTQTTILSVPWSRYGIKFVSHSENSLQLLQQVSEYMEFFVFLVEIFQIYPFK